MAGPQVPLTRGGELDHLVARVAARAAEGWLPDGWGFVQPLAGAVLRLERDRLGAPLVKLEVAAVGAREPLAVAYSTDYPQLERLFGQVAEVGAGRIARDLLAAAARDLGAEHPTR